MKQIVDELLPLALQCGISYFDFFKMTFAEVQLVIENQLTTRKREMQQKAAMAYTEASLIAMFISRLFSEKTKVLSLYDAFPDLFADEKKAEEERRLKLEKDNLMAFVQRHNKEFNNALQNGSNSHGENEQR